MHKLSQALVALVHNPRYRESNLYQETRQNHRTPPQIEIGIHHQLGFVVLGERGVNSAKAGMNARLCRT